MATCPNPPWENASMTTDVIAAPEKLTAMKLKMCIFGRKRSASV